MITLLITMWLIIRLKKLRKQLVVMVMIMAVLYTIVLSVTSLFFSHMVVTAVFALAVARGTLTNGRAV